MNRKDLDDDQETFAHRFAIAAALGDFRRGAGRTRYFRQAILVKRGTNPTAGIAFCYGAKSILARRISICIRRPTDSGFQTSHVYRRTKIWIDALTMRFARMQLAASDGISAETLLFSGDDLAQLAPGLDTSAINKQLDHSES